jgi:hypothetical protein
MRLWLLRLRLRLGGVRVWVCPECYRLTYWPWIFRTVVCDLCDQPGNHVPCIVLEPRDWAYPRGRWLAEKGPPGSAA